MSSSSLWQTHWKTACWLQPKKMQGELQQSHSGMTRADDSCCWLKSKCLRLHQRNCGLLHVSLLPSQCLQQLDVMWILQMESTLAQMVLPDCKHKQWNAFRGLSGEPLLWFKCSVYQCVKLSKHANVVPKVLPPALEQTPTSAHYAIFPMISIEQSRPLPA